MIGSELLRYRTDQRFNVTDFETNGLHLQASLPWQISYAVATQKGIQQSVTRYIRWPDFKMTEDAARVTRFDMRTYLERAEDPEKVLKDYEEIAFDRSIWFSGHNILLFDAYIFDSWRVRMGRKSDWSFLNNCLDTNCLVKAHQKQWQPDRGNMLGWQYKIANYYERGLKSSLGFSCRMFQIPYDENRAHDAGYDVYVNSALLGKLIWAMEI